MTFLEWFLVISNALLWIAVIKLVASTIENKMLTSILIDVIDKIVDEKVQV